MGLSGCLSAGSVQHNISENVLAIVIPEGAHHVDFMFANAADLPSVTVARDFEMAQVSKWIREHRARLQLSESIDHGQ